MQQELEDKSFFVHFFFVIKRLKKMKCYLDLVRTRKNKKKSTCHLSATVEKSYINVDVGLFPDNNMPGFKGFAENSLLYHIAKKLWDLSLTG